jgi:hypothetical protein
MGKWGQPIRWNNVGCRQPHSFFHHQPHHPPHDKPLLPAQNSTPTSPSCQLPQSLSPKQSWASTLEPSNPPLLAIIQPSRDFRNTFRVAVHVLLTIATENWSLAPLII